MNVLLALYFSDKERRLKIELLISLLTFGGTVLLVVTGLLNFSVFVRQLRAALEQLETPRRQLESACQQPQIQLVPRAMAEMTAGCDAERLDEVKAVSELLLNTFASAIIRSAVLPDYPGPY